MRSRLEGVSVIMTPRCNTYCNTHCNTHTATRKRSKKGEKTKESPLPPPEIRKTRRKHGNDVLCVGNDVQKAPDPRERAPYFRTITLDSRCVVT